MQKRAARYAPGKETAAEITQIGGFGLGKLFNIFRSKVSIWNKQKLNEKT